MNSFRYCLCLLILTGCHYSLTAQDHYLIREFTTDNGLPSNGIKGLQLDEGTGFLWIATEAGIIRYNGSDFLNFSPSNTPHLTAERMLFLFKNREGKIFTADNAGNVFVLSGNKPQFVGQVKLDDRASVFKLIGLAASEKMFRLSSGQSPAHLGFDYSSEAILPFSDTQIVFFHGLNEYGYKRGLYEYDAGRDTPDFLCSADSGSRFFLSGGTVYGFGSSSGFLRFTPDLHSCTRIRPVFGKDSASLPPLSEEHLIWEVGMKAPVLIAGSGAWELRDIKGQLVARLICNAVPTDVQIAHAVYWENEKILFLGTKSRGMTIIRSVPIEPVRKRPVPADKPVSVYGQIALSDSSVLVNEMYVLGGTAPSSLPVRRPYFNRCNLRSADSTLWYSYGDSIFNYSYKTRQSAAYDAGDGAISSGLAFSGGHLYVANSVGIGVLQDGRVRFLYRHPKPEEDNNVPSTMMELQPGLLAIATCNGLWRFNTATCRLDTLLSIPGICVRALWKYHDYLFISTYGKGIYGMKNNIIKPLPADKNHYLDYAHCFIADKQGYCWISTNKGLFRASPEDMIRAFEENTPEIYYHYYGRDDGLAVTELNGGCSPCALALTDHRLSFPTMDGLAWVDPAKANPESPKTSIFIDGFLVDKKPLDTSHSSVPELSSTTRDIELDLGFPSWWDNENIYIKYKLEPYSKDWESLKIQAPPSIHYSNLSPGDYKLSISWMRGFGAGSSVIKTVEFRILPYWYQRAWVRLLGLIFLALCIWGYVRGRTSRYRKRQAWLETNIEKKTKDLVQKTEDLEKNIKVNSRLISIISHDLIGPLSFLHRTGKKLLENAGKVPGEVITETIGVITNTSGELVLLSRNMLNWIKFRNEPSRLTRENFLLYDIVKEVLDDFHGEVEKKGIRLENAVDPQLSLYQLAEPLKVVLYHLVQNGINFTTRGYVRVSSKVNPGRQDEVAIVIEDTGTGMSEMQITNISGNDFIISSVTTGKAKGQGLGYLIVQDLLKLIGGRLSIKSRPGKGTEVTILL